MLDVEQSEEPKDSFKHRENQHRIILLELIECFQSFEMNEMNENGHFHCIICMMLLHHAFSVSTAFGEKNSV